jgi:hypothetical protein
VYADDVALPHAVSQVRALQSEIGHAARSQIHRPEKWVSVSGGESAAEIRRVLQAAVQPFGSSESAVAEWKQAVVRWDSASTAFSVTGTKGQLLKGTEALQARVQTTVLRDRRTTSNHRTPHLDQKDSPKALLFCFVMVVVLAVC